MWNKSRGVTLVELVLAIVVLGVGVTGVLTAFNLAVRGSADPMVRKQMLAVAEEMIEEVSLKPYAHTPTAATGCARSAYDDIRDYHGYSVADVCDIDGNGIPALAGYAVRVDAVETTLNGIAAIRIVVTVTRGSDTLSLSGYRTDWAS